MGPGASLERAGGGGGRTLKDGHREVILHTSYFKSTSYSVALGGMTKVLGG